VQAVFELADERGRVKRRADRRVVRRAMLVEIRGQVAVGVAPTARADDPDLAAADRVAQRPERAQLVRHALHPAVLVQDGIAPRRRDDAVQRDVLGGVIAAHAITVGVALQEREGVDHGPVRGVVAAKLKRREQLRQHPAVVARVGGVQHRPHARPERPVVGLGFADEVTQRLLADDGVDRLPDGLLGLADGGLGDREQQTLLAAHAPQVFQ
jgi:hypothetical protein